MATKHKTVATVTVAFKGRADHEAHTRTIMVGETLHGELAEAAIAEGWALETEASTAARAAEAARRGGAPKAAHGGKAARGRKGRR